MNVPATGRRSPAAPAGRAAAVAACHVLVAGCTLLDQGSNDTRKPTAAPAQLTSTTPTPSPTPQAFEDLIEEVRSGVVRLAVTTCDGSAVGSGFLLSPNLVATVAHVVEGASVLRVVQGTTSTAGRVIGADAPSDVALVETVAPLEGHKFIFAGVEPRIGDRLAVLGFPRGGPLSVTQGTVNGLDRKEIIDGLARHSLIEHDAASHGGSSGGAVIDVEGRILGLHSSGPTQGEGGNMAVSGRLASGRIDTWQASPEPVDAVTCSEVAGPQDAELPDNALDEDTLRHVGSTLAVYFAAINNGDFTTAFAQRTGARGTLEGFREAVRSSQDSEFEVQGVRRDGDEVVLSLDFTSRQEAGAGPRERPDETCTRWSLDYAFQPSNGLWLITRSAAREGRAPNAPCAEDRGGGAPSDGVRDEPT